MCKEQTKQKPDAVGVAVEPEVRFVIAKEFERVDDWDCDGYRLRNNTKQISFWIANGLLSFRFDKDCGLGYKLTFFDKFFLWGKAKKLIEKLAIKRLCS